jgi:hypothetical protein
MKESAYEILDGFNIDDLRAVYELAGAKAIKDEERCPVTFDEGVRILAVAEEYVYHIRELSAQRAHPLDIAAAALRFPVWRQPFKNCNHRTGYAMCRQVLELFGYELCASKGEITEYVFSINKYSYSEKEVREWLDASTRLR